MLFDTDVLIWVFRGDRQAADCVDRCGDRFISIVSLMELFQGARDRQEVRMIKDFLRDLGFRTIPLSENIGHRAVIYVEQYALRSGLRVADALVAATSVESSIPLLSGDSRHYRTIAGLDFIAFKP